MSSAMLQVHIQPGTHCLFGSIRNALASSYGYSISEAELYFMCDGLNVEYDPAHRPFWVGRSGEVMLQQFALHGPARLRYDFRIDGEERKRELLRDLRQTLVSGHLALLFVNSSCLGFHKVYLENPGRQHVIILYGLDESNDTAYVGDSFLLDDGGTVLTYNGPTPLQKLLQGVYGAAFMDGLHTDASRKESVTGLAAERIRRFISGKALKAGVEHGHSAYMTLFDDLEQSVHADDSSFTERCKEAYYCLRIGGILHQLLYMKQFAEQYPREFAASDKDWPALLEEEETLWKKRLWQLYKLGLQRRKEGWPLFLEQTKELMDRETGLLREYAGHLQAIG